MSQKTPIPTYVLAPLPPERGGRRPWRKVHLDFHNSRHIKSVGHDFDAEEFIATLKKAKVDSIVVFAKDMHGYCYYPSPTGPVHPGLKRDLLGEQVKACRDAGIEVYAYYCTLWDHHLAETHPEWLSVKRDGTTYMPEEGEPPGWTALCASNEGLVELIETHVREILTGYDVDGIWFDMPIPRDGECFCANCLPGMAPEGTEPPVYPKPDPAGLVRVTYATWEDPLLPKSVHAYQQEMHIGFLRRLYQTANEIKPGIQVDFNNQPCFGLDGRFEWMDNIDIEALPTAEWGYDFFPTVVRYVRTVPRTTYGMTGRFLRSWGDFGGLKTRHQLTSEAFGILAQGTRCDIGDQMPPSGRLDPAVYEAIGAAYSEVSQLEESLEGAQTLAEAVVLVEGLPLDSLATPSHCGLVKLLSELNIQFDVMEFSQDWERYPLAILAKAPTIDRLLWRFHRVKPFIEQGGLVLDAGGVDPATPQAEPAYFVMEGEGSPYEFVIYGRANSSEPVGTVIAEKGVPAFTRSGARYTSHAQSPFDHKTGRAVAQADGSSGHILFDIGKAYAETGYWAYRHLLDRTLEKLYPNRLVRTTYGGSIQVTLAKKGDEILVHVFDATVGRPSPGHPPYYETAPMRKNVLVYLNFSVESAEAVRGREDPLVLPNEDGTTTLCLKELDRYELIRLRGVVG